MCILGLDKKPCQGKAVQTKPCNLHACPAVGPSKDDAVVLPLIVKSMRASSRPQREEPCIIKEGDLELVRDDLLGFKVPPRTAARVVLNNSTFSLPTFTGSAGGLNQLTSPRRVVGSTCWPPMAVLGPPGPSPLEVV